MNSCANCRNWGQHYTYRPVISPRCAGMNICQWYGNGDLDKLAVTNEEDWCPRHEISVCETNAEVKE